MILTVRAHRREISQAVGPTRIPTRAGVPDPPSVLKKVRPSGKTMSSMISPNKRCSRESAVGSRRYGRPTSPAATISGLTD